MRSSELLVVVLVLLAVATRASGESVKADRPGGRAEEVSASTCAPDSARSAGLCVDRYEESLWDVPPSHASLIKRLREGKATLADLKLGGAKQVGCASAPFRLNAIPQSFPVYGNYTTPLYAASVAGVLPTTCISVYQAAVACQIAGKRLLTNAEWNAAAKGTPETSTDNGTTDCNTGSPGKPTRGPSRTGARTSCRSEAGVFDAVGNAWEWTTESPGSIGPAGTWVHGGAWDTATRANLSLAGKHGPLDQIAVVGFRCAR